MTELGTEIHVEGKFRNWLQQHSFPEVCVPEPCKEFSGHAFPLCTARALTALKANKNLHGSPLPEFLAAVRSRSWK